MAKTVTYEKLDSGFKTKWLNALRSGRYRQTSYVLRRDTHSVVTGTDKDGAKIIREDKPGVGYCCLGVGLNLLSTKWRPSVDDDNDGPGAFDWGRGSNAMLTTNTKNLPFVDNEAAEKLATMNDDGHTFAEIADWIEENL